MTTRTLKKRISFGAPKPSETGKTKVWKVRSSGDDFLGEVRWFGRWRRYAFHPDPFTIFEQECLREIADFCEQRSREQRQQWRKK